MLVDQHEREQALDISRSFCVTAPAGSGKTELLTQRYLRLLAIVDEPEQVLAVTFTRKARAEMTERILRALQLGLGEQPEQAYLQTTWAAAQAALAQDASKGWKLRQNTSRLRVQTIDSLNQAIAGESPLLNGFGSTPSAVDDANKLYLQVIPRLLKSLDDADSDLANALTQVLLVFNGDTDRFSQLLCSLLAKRDQWLQYVSAAGNTALLASFLDESFSAWVETDLATAEQALAPYGPALIDSISFAVNHGGDKSLASIEVSCDLPACTVADIGAWQALANFLLTAGGDFRKTMSVKQGFPAKTATKDPEEKQQYVEAKQKIVSLLEELRACPDLAEPLRTLRLMPKALDPQQAKIANHILLILKYAVANLSLVFAESGQCDHIQIALSAAAMLDDGDGVATPTQLRWNQRVQHILIDEFQDTSIIQHTILERLIALWPEAREHNPEILRSLFVVGDGMQSIYRFRAANVGLFIQASQSGIGTENLDAITLRQNFRSDAALVDWFNTTFSQSFPSLSNASVGAVPYSDAMPNREGEGAVTVQSFASRNDEAEFVAAEIERLQQQNPSQSMAILVRARSHLTAVTAALAQHGIAYQSNDIKYLNKIPQVIDVISLTLWILDESDDISLAAILRAPWCGASLQELYELGCVSETRGLGFKSLAANIDRVPERLQGCFKLLYTAWQHRARQSLANTVKGLWVGLGGPQCAGANHAYVEQYLQHLQDNTDIQCADTLNHALTRMFAKPLASDANVHLMTIHKSKGLEFDAVFLMGLGKGSRADIANMLEYAERLHDDKPPSFLLAPWGKSQPDKQLRQYVKNLDRQANQHEMLRVLYVGATRAASKLCLSFVCKLDDKAEGLAIKPPASNSLIRSIWGYVASQNVINIEILAEVPVLRQPAAPKRMRQHLIEQAPLDSAPTETPAVTANIETAETALGTLLHQLLEQLALNEGRASTHLRNYCATQIEQSPHIQDKHSAQQQVAMLIKNVSSTELGQWVIGSSNAAYNEWPLSTRNIDNTISRYVIDRSFVEGNIRWIIDYKTSTPKEGESVDDFLQRQEYTYRRQLAQYAYAVSHLRSHKFSQNSIKAALYFPLINILHEVPLG